MNFQLELRRHIALRGSRAADVFWRKQLDYLGSVIGARQSARDQVDDAQAEALVAGVMCEFVIRAWRTFRGQSEAELRGFLRGILLHQEATATRHARIEGDLVHYAGLQQPEPVESTEAAAGDPMGEPGRAPQELTSDDLRFLARLTANKIIQQDAALEMGTSESTLSRKLLRLRKTVSRLTPEERDQLELWLRRGP